MKNTKNFRQSNYELMRIISMFFIVFYHVIMHCALESKANGITNLVIVFTNCLLLVHVNSFVLLCGYFQCKSKFKMSKVLSLINETWFYKVLFMVIALVLVSKFGFILTMPITVSEIIETLMPFDYGIYWFIGCYIVLYCISPILNKLIDSWDKKELKKWIIVLFVLFSIIGVIGQDMVIFTRTGHSLSSFILLYFIGAYLRKYPITKEKFFEKIRNGNQRLIYFSIYLLCAFLIFLCHELCIKFNSMSSGFVEIGKVLNGMYTYFSSPILIIETIAYFLFFGTFNFKSKFINFISKFTFAVYLIHENIYVWNNLYNSIGISKIEFVTPKIYLWAFAIAVSLFVISIIIEIFRYYIFKFIRERKIFNNFRLWYRKKFNNLGFNIN